MPVLITGATGLLGEALFRHFSRTYRTYGWSKSTQTDSICSVDLNHPRAITDSLSHLNPDIVIHAAAGKDPDWCHTHREEAFRINVLATKCLSDWCADHQKKFIFISTDSVFNGDNPLYSETSPTGPINYYGFTKELAEKHVHQNKTAIIARIPLLYGARPKPGQNLIEKIKKQIVDALTSKKALEFDHQSVRTPTHADDVSFAIDQLIERNFSGIIHVRADDRLTYLRMAEIIADVLNVSVTLKSRSVYPTLCPRPFDPSMNTRLYENLHLSGFRSFKEGVHQTLYV